MAFSTSNIPKAIEPLYPKYSRGTGTPPSRVYRLNASQTIVKGDVIIANSGKADRAGTGADVALAANALGIAAGDVTSGASVGESDFVVVFDADGCIFAANLVGGVATDHTMSDYSNLLAARPILRTTDPSGSEVYAIGDTAATNDEALVIELVRTAGQKPGDSLVNPRVAFAFVPGGTFLGQ